MKRNLFLTTFLSLFMVINGIAQPVKYLNREIHGSVVDSATHAPLLYASIYVVHHNKGVISNENGLFSLDVSGMSSNDTICFHYIGYKTECLPLVQLDTNAVIYLPEDIYDLDETLVFGNAPDPASIVKKVLKNKASNYKKTTCVRQTFVRERDIVDFDSISLNYKKSTIPELDQEKLKLLEENIPKYTASYTDFLGNIYFIKNQDDSVKLKIEPIRTVTLKEKEYDELKQFDTLFENLLTSTEENEYWKFKSGIFGEKIDEEPESPEPERDTINRNKRELIHYRRSIESQLNYSLLDNKDEWEFLYETGRYKYSLAGGTGFNGEDVYIIDFSPDKSGLYTGRMYISTNTYALIRADYEYAPGKTGRDIHLLGIGYTENEFSGSIYFEKKGDNYLLKYFSKKSGTKVSVDRNVEISKKRKRVLFDKEIMEFKAEIEIAVEGENSIEYYVLDDREIPDSQFEGFKQPESMEIIFVDQFDDKLWSGYSIIEPTKKMREYKKQQY